MWREYKLFTVTRLTADVLGAIVDRLALAVFVFRRNRLAYANAAADTLRDRLRSNYRIEVDVILRDHLRAVVERSAQDAGASESAPLLTLVTASNGEPFYVHVIPLWNDEGDVAVTVRAIGAEIDACRRRYGLSAREAQVAELVLHGYRNNDIAAALGITPATTKKHLTRIFDKVGVDTRSQLLTRLA
jgi:DNA-binding CsgD family transcriptional regulator